LISAPFASALLPVRESAPVSDAMIQVGPRVLSLQPSVLGNIASGGNVSGVLIGVQVFIALWMIPGFRLGFSLFHNCSSFARIAWL
jgi:hypothetical protein